MVQSSTARIDEGEPRALQVHCAAVAGVGGTKCSSAEEHLCDTTGMSVWPAAWEGLWLTLMSSMGVQPPLMQGVWPSPA